MAFTCAFFILTPILIFSTVIVEADAFTADLIHRDSSPNSPFFTASETLSHRLINVQQRSTKRLPRLSLMSNNAFGSSIIPGDGNFLMKLYIGTPPTQILATIDTSSSLIWLPCNQRNTSNNFYPLASSTYQKLSCDSYQCKSISSYCDGAFCSVQCPTQDQLNFPNGVFSIDTFTFVSSNNQPFSFPNSLFACGTQISDSFAGVGFVGLAQGPLSLASQTYNKKFSYCLGPYFSNMRSKINFGAESFDTSNEESVVSTTPLGNNTKESNYYITLESITVGNKPVFDYEFYMSASNPSGNTLIDTATFLTHLPEQLYFNMAVAVTYALSERGFYMYRDDTLNLKNCYQYSSDFRPPKIVMNFKDNANVELSTSNSFIRISEDLICLAFQTTEGNNVIYGSWQQTDYLVGYDLQQRTVSFIKANCTNP